MRFDGLPEGAWTQTMPVRRSEGIWVRHKFVHSEYQPEVLKRMESQLERAADPKLPRGDRLDALANYYQLGINCHLFSRVNNSLLMAQVNALLRTEGLIGIGHGILDLQAWVTESPRFAKHFRSLVAERNPGISLD